MKLAAGDATAIAMHSNTCANRAGAAMSGFVRSVVMVFALAAPAAWAGAGPAGWAGDLSPIGPADWNYERAAHLLERAGFGSTPAEIRALAQMTPEQAVRHLVDYRTVDNSHLRPFDESGVWEADLDPFPVSRPATTEQAKARGEALGVEVKPAGNRPMQP